MREERYAVKTSESIERLETTKGTEQKGKLRAQNSAPVSAKYDHRLDAVRLKPYQFKPGESGNPGGKPKIDVAGQIARAIFENDGPAIYAAYSRMLRKGSAYCFQVLAERGYGKLRESIQHEISPYRDVSDQELHERIAQLERELGIAPATDALPSASEKPN